MNNNIDSYLVFYPKSRDHLALTLGRKTKKRVSFIQVDQKLFPDSEPNFSLRALHDCYNRDVLYIADWTTCEHRYYDLLCLVPIAEMGPRTLTVLLPFLGSGTMERESVDGSIATANVEAKLLSWIPGAGIKRVITVDLHTLQNQFYYNNTSVTMESAMPYVIDLLKLNDPAMAWTVCFPDNGAKSRFSKYFYSVNVAICGKVRRGDERIITLEEGDVRESDVIIVDDLVRTGSTLLSCAGVLKDNGAKTVSIFVTHGVFPGQSWKKFLSSPLIDKVYITDSVYSVAQEITAADPTEQKFKVIDLGECIYGAL